MDIHDFFTNFVMIDNKYRYHYIKKKAVYFPKDLVKAYNLNKSIKKDVKIFFC